MATLLLVVPTADACSCAPGSHSQLVAAHDVAFLGTPTRRELFDEKTRTYYRPDRRSSVTSQECDPVKLMEQLDMTSEGGCVVFFVHYNCEPVEGAVVTITARTMTSQADLTNEHGTAQLCDLPSGRVDATVFFADFDKTFPVEVRVDRPATVVARVKHPASHRASGRTLFEIDEPWKGIRGRKTVWVYFGFNSASCGHGWFELGVAHTVYANHSQRDDEHDGTKVLYAGLCSASDPLHEREFDLDADSVPLSDTPGCAHCEIGRSVRGTPSALPAMVLFGLVFLRRRNRRRNHP